MSVMAKTITSWKLNLVQPLILRLCNKRNRIPCINIMSKRTLFILQRFSKQYKHFFLYQKQMQAFMSDIKPVKLPCIKSLPEHVQMHRILENSIHYSNTIMQPIKTKISITSDKMETIRNTDWSSESPESCYHALKKLAHCYLNGFQFDNETYDKILEACRMKLHDLNDSQIQNIMQYLIVLNNVLKPLSSYSNFIFAISKQCLKRFFSSDIREMLFMISGFYLIEAYTSAYMWRALRKLGSKCYRLTAKNLVQFLLYLSVSNVSDINMFDIECYLDECINDLTGNEIGIAARGFFMNETKIHLVSLMKKIITVAGNKIQIMDNVCVGAVMKLIRYSDCSESRIAVRDMLILLRPEIKRLPLISLTHISHVAGGLRVYDKILLDDIAKRVENEFESARLKDIERIIYALCTVTPGTQYQDTCYKIVDKLLLSYKTVRANEISYFPTSLLRILQFLSYKNIYPEQLFAEVMDPKFVQTIHRNNIKYLSDELLRLHCSIIIERPNYTGPFLSHEVYSCLIKKHCHRIDVANRHNTVKVHNELMYLLKDKLGLNTYIDFVLPHFSFNYVVLGFDEHNNSVDVEPILSTMKRGTIKRVDTDDLKKLQWKILIPLTKRNKVIGYDGYTSHVYTIFRQLKAIGYTPRLVNCFEWEEFTTDDARCKYLHQLIFDKNDSDHMEKQSLLG
ncbi:uncharacterized protein LOC128888171 [Hylaeus anthracinus]|uniref:uncharacterized protein LOC128888171 n=1 Tax=Hylaeus anthracinus TaxID=313031 RepID=UPI0023B9648F|nr:uncharacterized protein LOC128888171 [Hylaeus anthracinus]